MRSLRRPTVLVLAMTLIVAACGSATPSSIVEASAPAGSAAAQGESGSSDAATPAIGDVRPATDPGAAASAVRAAQTDEGRRDAILAMFAGMGIGVYRGDGAPVVAGAERSAADFWVYDFEVDALAASIGEGELVTLDDMASDLAAAGVTAGAAPIGGEGLSAAIRQAQDAASTAPSDPASYPMLAARTLGFDAASATATPGTVRIDELTGFLILADLLLPSLAAEPPPTAAEPPAAAADAAVPALPVGRGLLASALTAASPCDQIATQNQRNSWSVGQLAQALAGGVHRGMPLSSYLHAFLMNAMVDAQVRTEDFHMAHDTTAQAQPRHQVVTYTLRIDPSRRAVECGLLRAALLGVQGGIKAMPVTWSYGSMERFADPICAGATCGTTDATGTVTLATVPKAEPQPAGIGPEFHETVQLTATGDVLQALGPDLWSRLPGTPVKKAVHLDVDVAYHRSYDLFLHVDSKLRIIQENPAVDNSLIATAKAKGDLDIKTARDRNGRPTFVFEVDTLTMDTKKEATGGHCSQVVAYNKSGEWESGWMVLDAVVYPADALLIALDSPVEDPVTDELWTYLCTPKPKQLFIVETKTPATIWESWLFRGHHDDTGPYGGLLFAGSGSEGWTYLASDDTWTDGGRIATWHSTETCGGTCTGTLDMDVWVTDVRLP